MPAMATALVLTEVSDGKFTYTTSGHTALKPKVVVSVSTVPAGKQTVAEFLVVVSHATVDAEGLVLPTRTAATVKFRQSIFGQASDGTAVLAILKDIVNSDGFANSIATLAPLKPL